MRKSTFGGATQVRENCEVCGKEIQVNIRKGTGICSGDCAKKVGKL